MLPGLLLRVLAAQGELWLDEIWSLLHVHECARWFEIFTLRHDNNHILNSLWLSLFSADTSPLELRALSVSAGCGVVLLTVVTAVRRSSPAYLLWAVFLATSYYPVLYGSEARGYAPLLLVAVSLFTLLTHWVGTRTPPRILLFSVLVLLGLLSHATFIPFLGAITAWLVLAARRLPWTKTTRLNLVGVGGFFTSAFWLFFLRDIEIGGAPILPYLQVWASTLTVAFGGAPISSHAVAASTWQIFAALALLGMCATECVIWCREKRPEGVLVLLVIAAPFGLVTLVQPPFILPRYFLLPVVFLYLLFASFLCRMWRQGMVGGCVAAILCTLCIAGNLRNVHTLIIEGRSQFEASMDEIMKVSNESAVQIVGEQDFQNSLRFQYLLLKDQRFSRINYLAQMRQHPESAWALIERIDPLEPLPETMQIGGSRFTLYAAYPAPVDSGALLGVFRREVQ